MNLRVKDNEMEGEEVQLAPSHPIEVAVRALTHPMRGGTHPPSSKTSLSPAILRRLHPTGLQEL